MGTSGDMEIRVRSMRFTLLRLVAIPARGGGDGEGGGGGENACLFAVVFNEAYILGYCSHTVRRQACIAAALPSCDSMQVSEPSKVGSKFVFGFCCCAKLLNNNHSVLFRKHVGVPTDLVVHPPVGMRLAYIR